MQIRKAERKYAKIKMAVQGAAGSGKTYSSLLIAYGLCADWTKIVIIDTENNSADLYADLGNYNVLPIQEPFTPEKYIQAITLCVQSDMAVIIIDSLSHAWEYLLDQHANMAGNSFTNWAKITPRQNALVNAILQSNTHIIATMRVKQDYVLNQKDGKYIPEKVGLRAIQRDGLDYEFTIVLDIDIKHYATASKDRTGLFMDKPASKISSETGEHILNWCISSFRREDSPEPILPDNTIDTIKQAINQATTIEELRKIFNDNPQYQQSLAEEFSKKKTALTTINQLTQSLNTKFNPNGSITINRT
ncbi:AAA family ATPase (plasmid) [Pedobacter sp. BS3]|uniref:AAA family ATPase n=1 Tax=Pedobacter sp. BS3 TaxID=2567937 RepID=UPI0011EF29DB|nr:AAA family ATPase [Pedobacter sp. BS3]TZF85810.1 AAA family ATPase [Pedobacter sp. BS3]